MIAERVQAWGGWATILLGLVAFLGIITLLGFGYRATRGWQHSSELLTARDTADAADLLGKALARDMAGMQSRVLASGDWRESLHSLADTSTRISIAFTRYPYPESFFSWNGTDRTIVFFNRSDRPPPWLPPNDDVRRFPVALVFNPPEASELRQRIDAYGPGRYRYVVFDTTLGGQPYQVVARLIYSDPLQEQPDGVIGFTVNLAWIREFYFSDLLSQVVRVTNREGDLHIGVVDDDGRLVWGVAAETPERKKEFPLLFLDPSFESVAAPPPAAVRTWAVHVSQGPASRLTLLARGADQAVNIAASAALMVCLSLVLAIRSIRTEVALATMRSDFVSSVTHDLKMPLANISLMADSLALRPLAADKIQRYAVYLRQESKRLSQLIDNLLAYARITDVAQVYSFEPLAIADLVRTVLESFQHPLSERQFAVEVDVAADLPLVLVDRAAILLAFSNLIDNAIRYSTDRQAIRIAARAHGSSLTLEVCDHGVGIPAEELSAVHKKFIRGKLNNSHGSGLGLAIVARVIADHRGTFTLESRHGEGTTARITVPIAQT